jgi:hypothetical protein
MIRARLLMGQQQQQQQQHWSQMEAWNWYHSSWKNNGTTARTNNSNNSFDKFSVPRTSRRGVLLFAQQRTLSETKGAD